MAGRHASRRSEGLSESSPLLLDQRARPSSYAQRRESEISETIGIFRASQDSSNENGEHCHKRAVNANRMDEVARKKLILASVLCLAFMIAEVIGGVLANSLAIATDAAHLMTDFASFMISLFSIYMAARPPTKRMSFGWYRAEVMGALLSVLLIWVVTGVLFYMAVQRVVTNEFEIDAKVMLITAGVGVAFNLLMGLTLHDSTHTHSHGDSHGHSHSGGVGSHSGGPGSHSGGAGHAHGAGGAQAPQRQRPSRQRGGQGDCAPLGLLDPHELHDHAAHAHQGHGQNDHCQSDHGANEHAPGELNHGHSHEHDHGHDGEQNHGHNHALQDTHAHFHRDGMPHDSDSDAHIQICVGVEASGSSTAAQTNGAPLLTQVPNGALVVAAAGRRKESVESVELRAHSVDDVSFELGGGDESSAREAERNINVRAAFIHVVGDMVQSVGVLTAAYIIFYKPEWKLADPICTFIFSFLVLFTTITILRDIVGVLMEGTPRGISFNEVKECLCGITGVRELHNLRLWSLTVSKTAMSVHLALDATANHQEVLAIAGRMMHDKFGVYECTVQIENYVDEMEDCEHCQDPSD